MEIRNVIHRIIINGTQVNFCWIPSHCGCIYNDWADRAAKRGAKCINATNMPIPLSAKEISNRITKQTTQNIHSNPQYEKHTGIPRSITTMAYRIFLNATKTKYVKIDCVCGELFSLRHYLYDCRSNNSRFDNNVTDTKLSFEKCLLLAKTFIAAEIGQYI